MVKPTKAGSKKIDKALSSGGLRGSVEPLNFEKTDFERLNFLGLLGILPHFSQFHRL